MTIFLSIFAYSQGENYNLLTKIVKDMNAKMKHDMEKKLILSDGLKKSYKTPKSLVVEFDYNEILNDTSNSPVGEGEWNPANERNFDENFDLEFNQL